MENSSHFFSEAINIYVSYHYCTILIPNRKYILHKFKNTILFTSVHNLRLIVFSILSSTLLLVVYLLMCEQRDFTLIIFLFLFACVPWENWIADLQYYDFRREAAYFLHNGCYTFTRMTYVRKTFYRRKYPFNKILWETSYISYIKIILHRFDYYCL